MPVSDMTRPNPTLWLIARHLRYGITVLFLTVGIMACGGGGSNTAVDNNTADNSIEQGPNPVSAADCAEHIDVSGFVTQPLHLTNGSAVCDYLITGSITATNEVRIDPGTRVRMSSGAQLTIDGGQLIAIGTAGQRISIAGAQRQRGFWRGIRLRDARDSRIEFVDISDGGIIVTSGVQSAALSVYQTAFSLVESTVSNSAASGLVVDGVHKVPPFIRFSNNQFFGNADYGAEVEGRALPFLDAASDYAGTGNANAPNGKIGIRTEIVWGNNIWTTPAITTLVKLNAPYVVDKIELQDDSRLTLLPGVQLLMNAPFGKITVEDTARLEVAGTQQAPVHIIPGPDDRGVEPAFRGFDVLDNAQFTLTHALIENGPINVRGSPTLTFSNTQIRGSTEFSVYCPDFGNRTWQIETRANVQFNGQDGLAATPACSR